MKIFGRGNKNDAQMDNDDLDIVSDDAAFEDAGDSFSAPARGMSGSGRGGSNKKFILLVVLLLVLGGGYAAMTMLSEPAMPVAALPPAQPLTASATVDPMMVPPVDPNAPLPVDAAGMPLPQDPAMAGMPQPGPDGLVPVPVTDAAMPAMPEMPPMPQPPATDVTAEVTSALPAVTDPAAAPAAAPVIDAVDAEAGIDPTVPATDPALAAVPPAPAGSAPGDLPVAPPVHVAASMDAPVPAVPVDATAPAMPAPAEMPATAPAAPAVVDATANPTAPGLDATAAAAIDAEQALVQNADLIPEVPVNSGARTPQEIAELWASLPTEPAMVRPLPQKYLTVKKESVAESLDSRLASARRALNDGRAAAALQFFNELRMDYPSDTRVLMGRAVALQRLGQNAEALQAYEEVLRADPKHLDALTNMLGLLKAQNPAMATEKLLALRSVYPYNADITTQLAISYGAGGDMNEALRYITLAEALKPESTYVLYNKAVIYDRLGRSREAGDMYRRLIRLSADGLLDSTIPVESIKRRLAVMR